MEHPAIIFTAKASTKQLIISSVPHAPDAMAAVSATPHSSRKL